MKYEGEERREPEWHVNKNVSLSIILLLITNIAMGAWFMSGLSSDVESLKSRPDLTARVIKLEALTSEQGRIISRIDATLDKFNNTLTRIDREQAKRGPIVYGQDKK